MTEATQEQITETEPVPTAEIATPRDVQRAALRDLVALATECATTETEIEQKHQKSTELVNKELDTAVWSAQQRHITTEEKIRQKFDARMTEVEARFTSGAAEIKKRDDSARNRIVRENDPPQRELRQLLGESKSRLPAQFGKLRCKRRNQSVELRINKDTQRPGNLKPLLKRHRRSPPFVDQYQVRVNR